MEIVEIRDPLPDRRAARVAAAVRDGFTGADAVPGLPVPDGAAETADRVRAALRSGGRLWLAVDGDDVLGAVRAAPHAVGWEINRLAVVPAARGRGLGRALVRALETGALAAGVPEVTLDAVVERGNPAFYARLGYRTVAHLPGPVLPLSEVTQRRRPGTGTGARGYPWHPGDAVPVTDAALGWFAVPGGTVAVPGPLAGDPHRVVRGWAARPGVGPGAVLAGVDCRPGGDAGQLARRVAGLLRHGGRTDGDVVRFDRPVTGLPPYRMPRTEHPAWLAVVRTPPG